jgi:hypothetical protein
MADAQQFRDALAALAWHDIALMMSPAHADQIRDAGWRWPFYEPLALDEPLKKALALLAETTIPIFEEEKR